ncbi:hypothetical protein Dimus_025561 [Dionaea muscipula]
MELRNCNHLHFIWAIRQDEVAKVLNVTRGKPALKFKGIQEIYNAQVSENDASLIASRARASRPRGGRFAKIKVQHKQEENTAGDCGGETTVNCKGSNDQSHRDLDDLNFGKMTLKQLRDACKANKRKVSRPISCSEKHAESSQCIKQKCAGFTPDDEVLDLDETISSLKSKLSRKSKVKKKQKVVYVPSGGNVAICKSEEIYGDQDTKTSIMDIDVPTSTKLVVLEPHYLESQDLTPPSGESSINSNSGLSLEMIASEVKVTDECCSSKQDYISSLKESPCCNPTEDCHEVMEAGDACFQNMESSSILEKLQVCDLSQVAYDCIEDEPTSSHILQSSKNEVIMAIHDLGIMGDQCLPAVSLTQKEYVSVSMTSEGSAENSSSVFHSSDYCGDSIGSSYVHGSPVLIDGSAEPESPSLVNSKLHPMEPLHDEVCQSKDDSGEVVLPDLPPETISSPYSLCDLFGTSNESLRTVHEVNPQDYDSPMTRERKSSTRDSGNAPEGCFPDGYPCNAADKVVTSTADGSCDHVEQQHAPQRLFSSRKIISPTSQERLSRLLDSVDLHDMTDAQKCKLKLLFEKQGESTMPQGMGNPETDETVDDMPSIESTYTSDSEVAGSSGKTRRVKNGKKFPHSKCIMKSPQRSQVFPRFSSGCSSIQDCCKRAMAFSQQQLHDTERLATTLTNELHAMKEVLVQTFQSEPRTFTVMRCKTNEVYRTEIIQFQYVNVIFSLEST